MNETQDQATSQSRPGKRERLINSARLCLHEQGVRATTIADIALRADVPPGNVHYYFKTRDEIVEAVIDAQVQSTRQRLVAHQRRRTPAARLRSLVSEIAGFDENIARYGCPIGTLCLELEKLDEVMAEKAAVSLRLMADWAQQQFAEMGRRDARALGVELIARYEGAATMTNCLRDPTVMRQQERRINRWIDSISADSSRQLAASRQSFQSDDLV